MAVKKAAGAPGSNSHLTLVKRKLAADTKIVVNQPLEIEDEFKSLYESSKNETLIVQPPFNPMQLIALCTRNNILQQCVHVMEVNVDGTGFSLDPMDPEAAEDLKEKKRAEDFFKEPYPGMSMVTLRRKLRVDMEQIGYGYMEVVRNIEGAMVFLRYAKASTIRLIKLDEPVEVEKTVVRDGKPFTAKMLMRERRYVQKVGQRLLYFKEYGSTRDIDKLTGKWADQGVRLRPEQRGSELVRFVVDEDAETPYGLPRWINNLPSVMGSRKSEEFNLEFFDSGGMPPAIIFVEGGAMTTEVRQQLNAYLSGTKSKHRAAVVEVQSSSGSLEAGGKVTTKVERFGGARQQDSMFQEFDKAAEDRVRGAFRIPPLFFGKSSDYNFATAMTAYMVTEEQVFAAERKEFDEIINHTVMKELGVSKYLYKSNPITLKNVDVMLKAIEMAAGVIDGEEKVKQLNKISGLQLEYSAEAEQRGIDAADPMLLAEAAVKARAATGEPGNKPGAPNQGTPARGGVKKQDLLPDVFALVMGCNEIMTRQQPAQLPVLMQKDDSAEVAGALGAVVQALEVGNERSRQLVEAVIKHEGKPTVLNLKAELKLPERQPRKKTALLPGGQKVTITEESS